MHTPLPDRFSIDGFWAGGSAGPAVLERTDRGLRLIAAGRRAVAEARLPHRVGSIMPGIVDAHVHLGLVRGAALADTSVVEVRDLGWIPEVAERWRRAPHTGGHLRIAGPFLTPPGGYPLGRPWAPDAAVREIGSVDDAAAAIQAALDGRHDLIKVVLHSGGPAFPDAVLRALIDAAHLAGRRVVVHAEGRGQAERALTAGADVLVHAPWNEALSTSTLRQMVAAGMSWISTLDIHRGTARAVAEDNVRRFLAAGGRVAYGTDMGNGPTPVGPNAGEILALGRAGLRGDRLLSALTGVDVLDGSMLDRDGGAVVAIDRAVAAPLPVPETPKATAAWFTAARRIRVGDDGGGAAPIGPEERSTQRPWGTIDE